MSGNVCEKLVEQRVSHKKYGTGVIRETAEKHIIVFFDSVGGKRFQYPDAFEKFLSISDTQLKSEIENDLIARSTDTDYVRRRKSEQSIKKFRAFEKRKAEEQQMKLEQQREKQRRSIMMREQRAFHANNKNEGNRSENDKMESDVSENN